MKQKIIDMNLIEEENDDESIKWKTIIDFTKIRKGGVPAKEVLKHLKLMKEQDSNPAI